jgi:hypothetical protein
MKRSRLLVVVFVLAVLTTLHRCGRAWAADPSRLAVGYREARWGEPLPAVVPAGCVASPGGWECVRAAGPELPVMRESFYVYEGRLWGVAVAGRSLPDCLEWLNLLVNAYGPPNNVLSVPRVGSIEKVPEKLWWTQGEVNVLHTTLRFPSITEACTTIGQHAGEFSRRKAALEAASAAAAGAL